MDIVSLVLIIAGLCLFETISSIDNAIINAEVLSTMQRWARRWFLTWGMLIAVFLVRGALPWLIIWATIPGLGPLGALLSTLSGDPAVSSAIEQSAPTLLIGGGVFLVFLFFHWLFVEKKQFGLPGERFFARQSVWFYAVVSVVLAVIVWFALQEDAIMAFGAVVGSTAFFIVHGFRQNAEVQEARLKEGNLSDISKLFYLEVIDATFSIDGVLGAFAFTLAVPLIILGNGLGAVVVRELTIRNIDRIQKYIFLKHGAMYSIFVLGNIMILDSFGMHIPPWLSPVATFLIVGYFFNRSLAAKDTGSPV